MSNAPLRLAGRACLVLTLAVFATSVPQATSRGASATFNVVVTVNGGCRVGTSVAPGAADVLTSGQEPDAEIHLACSSGVNARLGVAPDPSPFVVVRENGDDAAFFKDPARTDAWGLEQDKAYLGSFRSLEEITLPVYGRASLPRMLGRPIVGGIAEVVF